MYTTAHSALYAVEGLHDDNKKYGWGEFHDQSKGCVLTGAAFLKQVALVLRRLRELQVTEMTTKQENKRPSPRKMPSDPLLPLDEEAVDMDYGEMTVDGEQEEVSGDMEISFHLDSSLKTSSRVNSATKLDDGGLRKSKSGKQHERDGFRKAKQKLGFSTSEPERMFVELSNSSWSEMSLWVIGSNYTLYPLTPAIEQRLILQYLTPLGEYQEVSIWRWEEALCALILCTKLSGIVGENWQNCYITLMFPVIIKIGSFSWVVDDF